MNPDRLTKRILGHFVKIYKRNVRLFIEIKNDFTVMNTAE